jgi:hypothetical protein
MGAATFVVASNKVIDNKRVMTGVLTLSTSYATGGDSFAVVTQAGGLRQIDSMDIVGNATNTSGLSLVLAGTGAAPLMKAFETAGTEVASATNLAARTVTVRLYGS